MLHKPLAVQLWSGGATGTFPVKRSDDLGREVHELLTEKHITATQRCLSVTQLHGKQQSDKTNRKEKGVEKFVGLLIPLNFGWKRLIPPTVWRYFQSYLAGRCHANQEHCLKSHTSSSLKTRWCFVLLCFFLKALVFRWCRKGRCNQWRCHFQLQIFTAIVYAPHNGGESVKSVKSVCFSSSHLVLFPENENREKNNVRLVPTETSSQRLSTSVLWTLLLLIPQRLRIMHGNIKETVKRSDCYFVKYHRCSSVVCWI